MKAAIYLADGVTQVILTAETPWEKSTLAQIEGKDVTIFRGGFYECRGGWIRESAVYDTPYPRETNPESLMLRINKTTEI